MDQPRSNIGDWYTRSGGSGVGLVLRAWPELSTDGAIVLSWWRSSLSPKSLKEWLVDISRVCSLEPTASLCCLLGLSISAVVLSWVFGWRSNPLPKPLQEWLVGLSLESTASLCCFLRFSILSRVVWQKSVNSARFILNIGQRLDKHTIMEEMYGFGSFFHHKGALIKQRHESTMTNIDEQMNNCSCLRNPIPPTKVKQFCMHPGTSPRRSKASK